MPNMSKTYSYLITGLFLLFLVGMLGLHILTPDTDFSQNENRYLQEFPTLSWETFTGGSFLGGFSENIQNDFMSKFESYTTDQFPFRDSWISIKSWAERLTGKGENNGVYFADGDALIAQVPDISNDQLDKIAGYLNALGDKVDVPVYFGLIPSAAAVWQDKLPTGAPTADESAAIDYLYSQIGSVDTLDILGGLSGHADEDIYFRTDHHWNTLGSYYGYVAIMEGMGLTPVSLDKYTPTVVSDSFYGTSYSSSGVRWVAPDQIVTYVPMDGITVTSHFVGLPEAGSLYVDSFLEVKDKYSYFMGGNQPLCVIQTEQVDKPSVLVVRDSYSDCLAPYLTENFSEIHLLDLRYFNGSVSAYLQMSPLDNVIVLYSVGNLATDINLFKLGA